MLFLTLLASPTTTWMLLWLGAGFFMSERHRLTFVLPFVLTLFGLTDAVIAYMCLVWLCDFVDKPLFSWENGAKGQINAWLEKVWPKVFGPSKQEREEKELRELLNKDTVLVVEEKPIWRLSPKKIKEIVLKKKA